MATDERTEKVIIYGTGALSWLKTEHVETIITTIIYQSGALKDNINLPEANTDNKKIMLPKLKMNLLKTQ